LDNQSVKDIEFGWGYSASRSVRGVAYSDVDQDRQQDVDELPVSGLDLYVDLDGDRNRDIDEPSGRSDKDGKYFISNVPEGRYSILLDGPLQWNIGAAEVSGREYIDTANISVYSVTGLRGNVFDDINRNGRKDVGESRVLGASLVLDANLDGRWNEGERRVTSFPTMPYGFLNLFGTHRILVNPPPGYTSRYDTFTITIPNGGFAQFDIPVERIPLPPSLPGGLSST
jgi:hypothetical protein